MSDIVIVGGSVAGLANALALARHGHEVVVLERGDPPPEGPPGEAAQRWPRPTVPSFLQAHTLTSLGVRTLLDHAPEVIAAALDAGAAMVELIRAKPPEPAGTEPGDADLLALACRRSTLELVLHRIVLSRPEVRIRYGATVRGLTMDAQRVTGVVLASGERVGARIVLDATGRRAEARSWLAAHGIDVPPDATNPSGMRIFTRFYRRLGQTAALNRGNAAGVLGDHYASVLHPGDGATFSIALGVLPEDPVLRSLRDVSAFTAVATATPGIVDWLAPGMSTPISPIRAMTYPPNMLRTLAVSPAVPGLIPVGDAACVTNPMYGRGVSLALTQAFRLAELITSHDEPDASGLARELFTPWFDLATADDAERLGIWRAMLAGTPLPPPSPQLTMRTIARVSNRDARVWRAFARVLMGLDQPSGLLGDAGIGSRVRELLSTEDEQPAGPSRAELVEAVTRAEAA